PRGARSGASSWLKCRHGAGWPGPRPPEVRPLLAGLLQSGSSSRAGVLLLVTDAQHQPQGR
ncbi:hypothetical protein, partial [Sphaerotilus natans]|uniref:hypothetical protein n=1 Tax=Sphaerotilus natans TaxID=34103 RepID=UPI0019D3D148